jgi:tetratricopeptide (TPR) repeat protein
VISAIGGLAGVGKTALAVHWAHQVSEDFPDGQLYVNLRGYDPGQPLPVADALAGFLRALGVAGQDIPPEADERAARFRGLLAGRRMLVVLDNARSHEQVRPLLPGASSCAVLVTSRDALAGLIARDGAARLDLDLLPLTDAIGLLKTLIGRRAQADPDAAEALAGQCCRLPLALRVAAERAAARPADSLADLVAELDDQRRRLDLLDAGGDPATAVRAVFSWSYQHLDPGTARTFRLTGLHPGPDLDRYAAAALTSSTAAQAGRLLDRLARAHLLHPAGPGRYEMHDLLRAYARELSHAQDNDDERRAGLTRLFDHYLHAAAAATGTLRPAEPHRRPNVPRSAALAPPVTDPAAAQAWLDAHRASLVATVAHAADHGWPGHATRLAVILARHLEKGGYFPEATTMHTCAFRAARQAGDRAAEIEMLISLGIIDWRQSRYPQATRHLRQALALSRQICDSTGEVRALGNLGLIEVQQGRYPQATRHQRQALALCRQIGDKAREAHVLAHLGDLDARQGRYPQATRHLQQALAICRQTSDSTVKAYILVCLGDVDLRQGRYPQATRHFQQAIALFRQTGARADEACALASLGDVDLRQGRYPQATRRLQQALTLFRATGGRSNEACALASLGNIDLRQGRYPQATRRLQQALTLLRQAGDRTDEARVLNDLGEALLAGSQPYDARAQHASALALASQIGDHGQHARAHHGLGQACLAAGDPAQARRHWQQALTQYTRLGAPEADEVRAFLRHLDPATSQPPSAGPSRPDARPASSSARSFR